MRKQPGWKRRTARVRRALVETLEERSLLAALSTSFDGVSSNESTSGAAPDGELVSPEFRTLDGTFNNLQSSDLGAANQQHLRQTLEAYADGVSEPRGGAASTLANPRAISNAVHAQGSQDIASVQGLSQMVFQFGQFIDHDITHTPESSDSFDIPVPSGDTSFDPGNTGTKQIPMHRSGHDPASGTGSDNPRQQSNALTSFIDGSVIYGSGDERALALRAGQGGQMIMRDDGMLPINGIDTVLLENVNQLRADPTSLYVSGDVRVNEQIGLTAMHTLFSREHNYWADRIATDQFAGQDLNDSDVDEQIYQLTRQIVGAELQIISYNEFLPAVLGAGGVGEYQGYDANVDPRISNVFATAAYRVGHTMLPSELSLIDSDGDLIETRPLADAFFQPQVVTANGIEPILRGLASQPQQEIDRFLVDGVRNFLFGPPGAGGLDLASLNIQRGRDHGLATYNRVRIDFGLAPATSFADVSADPDTQAALSAAYASIDDVDVWVGGLAEDHLPGSNLGETFHTIWVDQFTRSRDGDRYFYKNLGLEANLVSELESTTLSDIIVRNTGIASLPNNVFQVPVSDFGDAPDDVSAPRYPTLLAHDGARHTIGSLFLGTSVDDETDGQPTTAADGDDVNDAADDDGVVTLASLVATGTFNTTTASLSAVASSAGRLDGWIDFNQDGDWDDEGEQILVSHDVAAGTNLISFAIPQGATPGGTVARFRLSSAGGLSPTGEAADGEVEDYIVNLLDGDAATGIDGSVNVSGDAITVSIQLGDVVVRSGSVDLFRAAAAVVGSLEITGFAGDESITIDVFEGLAVPPRGLRLDGGAGDNTVVFVGSGVAIDLTQPLVSVRNISTLDVSSDGANTLTINAAIVTNLSPTEKMLTIVAGEEDTIDLTDVDDWRMTDPVAAGGRFLLSAANLAGGNETLRADMPHAWQNFLRVGDVNNDGSITSSDALRIINELGRREFSDADTNDLLDPLSVGVWPGAYFDHNGDDRVTALDALRVINEMARLPAPEESVAGEAIVTALIEKQRAEPASNDSSDVPSDVPSVFSREFLVGAAAASVDLVAIDATIDDEEQLQRDKKDAVVDQLLGDESFFDQLVS